MAIKFNYNWNLKDLPKPTQGKVFSCFASGGGSSMGYKLAGFDVIGINEIDKKLVDDYTLNFNPKYVYNEDIRDFKLKDLPDELYNLDILDSSPPCTSFSMAGVRERDWGKKRKFKEGGAEQTLDDLFFEYIEVVDKLKPKIAIAENVKGIVFGKAKKYVINILKSFDAIGYYANFYLLDSSKMGVPQKRQRFFIVAVRKDLAPKINSNLKSDKKIDYSIFDHIDIKDNRKIDLSKLPKYLPELDFSPYTDPIPLKEAFVGKMPKTERQNYRENRFGDVMVKMDKPLSTIVTVHRYWTDTEHLLDLETLKNCGSWPHDYKWKLKETPTRVLYSLGMSVPPVMMAWVVDCVNKQYLKKINS